MLIHVAISLFPITPANMTVETVDNGVAPNGDTFSNTNVTFSSKKNKKGSEVDVEEGNVSGDSDS